MAIKDLSLCRCRFQSRAFLGPTDLYLVGAFVGPKWQAREDTPPFNGRAERWPILVSFKAARPS
ncbi:MAG TPA: hypothetical protein VE621_01635, partial [Bryobacteraceae bacterium]|nr:hypothetical protein [Bryobacteraceae bacterium]